MTNLQSSTNYLVTGGKGQVGRCLNSVFSDHPQKKVYFIDKRTIDITNLGQLEWFFAKNTIDIVINCAAFTHVDLSESNPGLAYQTNVIGVQNILKMCLKYDTKLIHLSTDYVFDGQKKEPYKEDDPTNPINQYGKSKEQAEKDILASKVTAIIIRSSWIFSPFGHNFLKSILTQLKTKKKLKVVSNQKGLPTYGIDLAQFILYLSENIDSLNHRLYHFANLGPTTWYNFAQEIINKIKPKNHFSLIVNNETNGLVHRPSYSVLDTRRIREEFNINPRLWKLALEDCIKLIQQDG